MTKQSKKTQGKTMKKLFISMAIICGYTYPAAQNSSIRQSHEVPDEEIINRSSNMTLYDQILTKFTKDLFFKELEQIRTENPTLTDPQELIRLAYAKVEEQSKIASDDLIAPYYFGLSIQDLIDNNLMPIVDWDGSQYDLDLSDMYINDLAGMANIELSSPEDEPVTLEQLDLSFNRISLIPPNIFESHGDLSKIYLHNNRILAIGENDFAGLNYIYKIDLSNNNITSIHPRAFTDLEDPSSLDFSNNKIEIIEAGTFANLSFGRNYEGNDSVINLSSNRLESISPEAFKGCKRLETLDLSNNNLESISSDLFTHLVGLKNLYIDNNKINLLSKGTFAKLNNLRTLTLSKNQLQTIAPNTFIGLNNLNLLYLKNNQLQAIQNNALGNLANLKFLSLSGNYIETIQPQAFAGLNNLHELNLQHNQLQNIQPEAFAGLHNLTKLSLAHNQLKTIQPDVFAPLAQLAEINLKNNHITNEDDISRILNELAHINMEMIIDFANQTPPATPSASSEQSAKRGRESVSGGSELSSDENKRTRTARSSIIITPVQLPSSSSSDFAPFSSSSLINDTASEELPPVDPFPWLNDDE